MLRNLCIARHFFLRLPITSIHNCSHAHNSSHKEEPVKFSISQASAWKASYSRSGTEKDEIAWFQPYVVTGSLAIFLLYFCVLREENDIDNQLGVSLFNRIEGLEEAQLRRLLAYNVEHGKETKDIIARIKELEDLRKGKN